MYFAATENFTYYLPTKTFEYVEGGAPDAGVDLVASVRTPPDPPPPPPRAYLLAWNPATQTEAWRAGGRGGGVLATAGNLVFQGRNRDGLLGELVAFRADNGAQVWSHRTPNAISAGPVTYRVDSEQYVAATMGATVMSFGAPGRVCDTTGTWSHSNSTDRRRSLRMRRQRHRRDHHRKSPRLRKVAEGERHYGAYCARCRQGTLEDRGMVGWARFLTPAQAGTIRAYVGEKARALQKEEGA